MAVHIGEPRLICVSDKLTKDLGWGYWQFPQIQRLADGRIAIYIHMDQDANFSTDHPYFAYISDDNGKTFRSGGTMDRDLRTFVYTRDGGRICLGFNTPGDFTYPVLHHDDPDEKPGMFCPDNYGMLPVMPRYYEGYRVYRVGYRLGDYPKNKRSYPVVVENARGEAVETYSGEFLDDEMVISAYVQCWDGERGGMFDVRPKASIPSPNHFNSGQYGGHDDTILVLPDGTWLLPFISDQTVREGIGIRMTRILESHDRGRTFTLRSCIRADETPLTFGHTFEHAINRLENGDLLYVVRLCINHQMQYTHSLAVYLSHDDGYTWERRPDISECPVLPSITMIGSEAVLVYGRPGVYVRSTKDGIHFTPSHTLVGIPEDEQPRPRPQQWWDEVHHRYSCANSTALKTGDKSMLVTYSDFNYPLDDGMHKAIWIVEITAD